MMILECKENAGQEEVLSDPQKHITRLEDAGLIPEARSPLRDYTNDGQMISKQAGSGLVISSKGQWKRRARMQGMGGSDE